MNKCVVEGCEKEAKNKKSMLCSAHEHRLRRYGSPTGTPEPKPLGVCAVEGCGGKLAGAGYCRKHYKRLRVHGDPLGGGTYKGEARAFVEAASMSDSDECIIFPFYRAPEGYGRLNLDCGNFVGAHFYACEIRNGARPSPEHEARHSCGNGHKGCVNGNHLKWGTRKQNVRDAIEHGTAVFWGVPVSAYKAFRSSLSGRVNSEKTQEWIAANDNNADSQETAA